MKDQTKSFKELLGYYLKFNNQTSWLYDDPVRIKKIGKIEVLNSKNLLSEGDQITSINFIDPSFNICLLMFESKLISKLSIDLDETPYLTSLNNSNQLLTQLFYPFLILKDCKLNAGESSCLIEYNTYLNIYHCDYLFSCNIQLEFKDFNTEVLL